MATMKVKFRASSIPTKEGTLFYQVVHGRVARQVNTGYKVYPCEWDSAHAEIVFPPGIGDSRSNYLASLKEILYANTKRFRNIIARLERAGEDYTAEDVLKCYLTPSEGKGFISFAREVIRQMGQIGKPRTAERYTAVTRSFERFCGENDVFLDEVDSDLMVRYENFLKAAGVCPNTTSYYMRGLRAIYNRAVEKELTVQRSPFRHVYTGIDKTVKRAVPLNIIRQIRDLDLTLSPATDLARDVFMFSFYTRGMSFIDMAFLKKKDLQNGILSIADKKPGSSSPLNGRNPCRKSSTNTTSRTLPICCPLSRIWKWMHEGSTRMRLIWSTTS